MTEDILNNNDGVVDKHTNRQGQGHQGHIVQRKIHNLHHEEGGNNRRRNTQATYNSSAEITQEHIGN